MPCPYCGDPCCYTDRHHLYWPRNQYKTKLERTFRGMHIVRIPRCVHNEIHATTRPPQKPSVNYMKAVIQSKGRRAA